MKKVPYLLLIMILVAFVAYKVIPTQGIKHISTAELEQLMDEKINDSNVVFIDVREVHEYQAGHIEGMLNYPLSSFNESYYELPKDKEIVIICRSGNRSMQAAHILKNEGYSHIVNVKGGMIAWKGAVVK